MSFLRCRWRRCLGRGADSPIPPPQSQFRPIGHAELAKDMEHVFLDRARGEAEFVRDFLVTAGEQGDDLGLAGREGGRRGGDAGAADAFTMD